MSYKAGKERTAVALVDDAERSGGREIPTAQVVALSGTTDLNMLHGF